MGGAAGIMVRRAVGGIGAILLLLPQNLQGHVLQIIEIHHVPVPLFLSIPAVKFFHQVQKGQKSPAAFLYRPGHLLRRLGGVKVPAFGRRLLGPVPAGGHEGLFLGVHLLAADGGQPVKSDR